MFLDNIDQLTPSQLAAALYHVLHAGNEEPETFERMKDRRLLPALTEIIKTRGRPPFAPPDLPKKQTDRVTMSAAYLLADIARPDDQETIQALMGMMDDENDRLKMAAATALGRAGAAEAAAKVLAFTEKMMERGEIGAVAKLARALAGIGGEDAKARLAAFVNQHQGAEDKHARHVVAEAETAIKEIDERLA